MIDMHTLSLYVGLCRNLHFGRTSEEFHVTPSALSRAIQRLEESVGHRLLVRDNRSVSLTPQGEIFREFAEETLSRFEDMRISLGLSAERLQGNLNLYASVTASQLILPQVLATFRDRYPDIQLQLETGYAVNALQRLREGADVVVAALPEAAIDGIEQRIITSTPMLTVAPLTGPALADPVDWSTVPLVLPGSGQARDNINEWLRQHRVRPNIYSEVQGNEAILSLVALGCGVGFVPELVLLGSPLAKSVRVVEEGPPLADFHVGFCTRRRNLEMSPLIRAFWESIG